MITTLVIYTTETMPTELGITWSSSTKDKCGLFKHVLVLQTKEELRNVLETLHKHHVHARVLKIYTKTL